MHDVPLNAFALAVNQPDFGKAGLYTLFKILFDHTRNIARLKWMEIDAVAGRKDDGSAEWRIRFNR